MTVWLSDVEYPSLDFYLSLLASAKGLTLLGWRHDIESSRGPLAQRLEQRTHNP
jgi:hypothetical protein